MKAQPETISAVSLPPTDTEALLVERVRRGNSEAFTRLCEPYRRRVWRVVATVTRGGADTDDLAQEAILKAWSSLKSYRAEASFEAWLCRIALNVAHDYVRSAWKRRVFLWNDRESTEEESCSNFADAQPGPEGDAERQELQRRVRAAVAKLKEKERVPIWLIYFEEFSLAEVARLEGVPESTVRSRVKAGLARLERPLADWNVSVDGTGFPPTGLYEQSSSPVSQNEYQLTVMESMLERRIAVLGRGYSR